MSRLDRLILLLESGSTPSVRLTAARQLGAIAGTRVSHPSVNSYGHASATEAKDELWRGIEGEWNEVVLLIGRILPHLSSRSSETRQAAAAALAHISRAVGVWDPTSASPVAGSDQLVPLDHIPSLSYPSYDQQQQQHQLRLAHFDLESILRDGTLLLSSSGNEYTPATHLTAEELVQAQKDALGKLGLGIGIGGGTDELGLDMRAELTSGSAEAGRSGGSTIKNEQGQEEIEVKPFIPNLPPPKFKPLTAGAKSLQDSDPVNSLFAWPRSPAKRLSALPSPTSLSTSFLALPTSPLLVESPVSLSPVLDKAIPSAIEVEAAHVEGDAGLSARELNRLKRRRKSGVKGGSLSGPSSSSMLGPSSAKVRIIEDAAGARRASMPALPAMKEETVLDVKTEAVSEPSLLGRTGEMVVIDPGARARQGGSVEIDIEAAMREEMEVKEGEWPWRGTVDRLAVNLLSSKWEVRHGASLGLREVLKLQGSGGGRLVGHTIAQNDEAHEGWCEDLATKLLCVFALDRFGDYVSDQVVAPVRETAAQTLATLLPFMTAPSIISVHRILIEMVRQGGAPPSVGLDQASINTSRLAAKDKGVAHPPSTNETKYFWQVRHSGLLGLKYLVAVKGDMIREGAGLIKSIEEENGDIKMEAMEADSKSSSSLLKGVVDSALLGLRDQDDDVRSAAAATLAPVIDSLVAELPGDLDQLITTLWNCLGDSKDDLSSSIGGVMDLLAKLLSFPSALESLASGSSLSDLIPRLFPFFRHTIATVRLAVVNTILVLLTLPSISHTWADERLFRLLYQNLIVEDRLDIRQITLKAWKECILLVRNNASIFYTQVQPHLRNWFTILMSPIGFVIDATLFWSAKVSLSGQYGFVHNVDRAIIAQDLSLVSVEAIMRGRVAATIAIGSLISVWPADTLDSVFDELLSQSLSSPSSLQQLLSATILEEWSLHAQSSPDSPRIVAISPLAARLASQLATSIQSDPPTSYSELAPILLRVGSACQSLYSAFDNLLPEKRTPDLSHVAFTMQQAHQAVNGFAALVALLPKAAKKKASPDLEDRQAKVIMSIGYCEAMKKDQDRQVCAASGAALVALRSLPAKLTPVIRSITTSIKSENNVDLQGRSARAIANLIESCSDPISPVRVNPSDKLIKNLCTFLCQDISKTPIFASSKSIDAGILSLLYKPARGLAGKDAKPVEDSEEVAATKLVFRGAQLALSELAIKFESRLLERVPKLWGCMSDAIITTFASGDIATVDALLASDDQAGQDLLDCLTVLPIAALKFGVDLYPRLSALLPSLALATRSNLAVVRYSVARCFAALCDIIPIEGFRHIVEQVIPFLSDSLHVNNRRGAMEVIAHIVDLLDIKILPYVIFLVVPVLGRMSDSDDEVRLVATNTFATLIKLVPLEAGLPDPPGFSADLLAKRQSEREFLTQLLDGNKVEPYIIPVPITIDLRKYQRDGVSWLAFLAKYQLHGLLCDDMGLGKTLQSICILASKHHERAERHKETGSPNSVHLPSLVVCPPTLTGHWEQEIRTYAPNLRTLIYTGARSDRERLVTALRDYDVVIMSYDIVRNDISLLEHINWNYCILDEGHVIKNGKTKLTMAVKSLRAIHRLILSGTPIQNNVLELWSLFDFLMPGFLGSEKAFNDRFGKPIAASRDAKSSSREQEAGALALEALHKQVLPFLLRRLKEDVLDDLPPKIIQDYYCELSPLQKQLYDAFSGSSAKQEATGEISKSGSSNAGKGQHVFQALQYLRKLVNHPILVLKPDIPQHQAIVAKVESEGGSMRDLTHAPKLQALQQILLDCGIGIPDAESTIDTVSQHRVLIFCQLKQMLDIVENDLFKTMMPSVTYMRMDGTTDVSKRHAVVQKFNSDPSIDCLLLTTHVGGLGLNLTGADTVIFVEHDWNPMKDLQAMDRAHRLGQKKVVNVYRLIMRGTLEEKIMGLQRFKLNIASSVVTQQNSDLASLGTDQILDLFNVSSSGPIAPSVADGKDRATSRSAILAGLDDLQPEDEYQDLDLSSFLAA